MILVVSVVVLLIYASSKRRTNNVQTDEYGYPSIVNRKDFLGVEQDLVVISFTSQTCESCKGVWEKVQALSSDSVGVIKVDYQDDMGKKLHQKYSIDAVPTTLVCDKDGVTLKSYIGAVTATDLWAGVANARGADIADCANH